MSRLMRSNFELPASYEIIILDHTRAELKLNPFKQLVKFYYLDCMWNHSNLNVRENNKKYRIFLYPLYRVVTKVLPKHQRRHRHT